MYKLKFVWRHSTPIIPSLTTRSQAQLHSRNFLTMEPVSTTRRRQSRCVRRNNQIINAFVVSRWLLHVMHINDKQILVFHRMFDLFWTGRGFPVSSVAFSKLREIQQFAKHGARLSRNRSSSPWRENINVPRFHSVLTSWGTTDVTLYPKASKLALRPTQGLKPSEMNRSAR
jgi:hypothetical protein